MQMILVLYIIGALIFAMETSIYYYKENPLYKGPLWHFIYVLIFCTYGWPLIVIIRNWSEIRNTTLRLCKNGNLPK